MNLFFVMAVVGCRMSDPTTFVDEVRILGIRPNPAEMSVFDLADISTPEDIPTVEIWIANPQNEQLDLLLWPCTNFGEGCLEKDVFAESMQDWVSFYEGVENYINVPLPLSPISVGVTTELEESQQPFGGTQIYALVCKQGSCPLIEDWKNQIYKLESISNPFELMETLPIQEASLSFRSLYFSTRPPELRIQHPTIDFNFSGIPNLLLDTSVLLPINYELQNEPTDTSRIYTYTTLGGFPSNDDPANAILNKKGIIDILWYAPISETWDEPVNATYPVPVIDEGEIFIFLEDGNGGVGVLREDVYLLKDSTNQIAQ